MQTLGEFLGRTLSGEERYKHRILEVCADLHAVATGSLDGMPVQKLVDLSTWLGQRLMHWSWGAERSAYDRLVYRLVEVTIAEVDAMLSRWNKNPLHPGYCDECGGHDCSDLDCELTRRAIFLWDNESGLYPGGTP